MIIDAMDLLYTNRFDSFCLVSSDSDFTRLAGRIRESGQTVYGFGERKTPKPFVAACDKFIYIENLLCHEESVPHGKMVVPETQAQIQQVQGCDHLAKQLRAAVEAASDENGWAKLSHVGDLLTTRDSDFDSRTYGYHKLSDLIADTSLFDITRHAPREGRPSDIYVRDKRRTQKTSA
ncbi:hypothetical protein VTK56DRAFT_3970 [Thermocarpiscus australiensis]